MKTLAPLLACVAIAAGAAAHGAATHRWSTLAPAQTAMDRLHAHAVTLGDYQSEEVPNDLPLKEKSTGTCRRYTSAGQNQGFMVSVISGAAGSVATHTPDVCYVASGYKMMRPPLRETIDVPGVGSVSYYVSEFVKTTATRTERQRVRWSWTADGTWAAPDNPRFAYLRTTNLAKVYIVTQVSEADALAVAEDAPAVKQFTAACFAQYHGLFDRPPQ